MLKYLKKYWLFTMLAPLFMIGEVSMDLIQPELMSHIIDDGVLGINSGGVGNLDIILGTGIRMVLLVAAGGVCGVMSGVFANLSAQQFGNDVRKDTFKRIMSFSFEQTDKFSTGSLITRVTNDITQLQNFVMQCMRGFVRTSMLFIGGIVCMIGLNIQFGLVIACALPFIIICVIYFIAKGALKDAIYATFIFNFRYAKASTNEKYLLKEQIKTIVYLIPIFTVFLVSCFKKNKLKTKNILSICMVVMSVFAIALQISGQPYRHYLIIWLPLLCIGVCIVDLKSIKYRTYRYVLMLFLIISSCIVIGKNVSVLADSCNLVTKNEEQDYAKYVNDLKEKIPGDKLDRVIAYNVLAKFYIISDIKPCYKYCILQDWQCSHDSEMTLEFEKMIKSLKAQYIVITRDSINAYDGYINQHYHQKYENKYFELLEINYNTNYVKGR